MHGFSLCIDGTKYAQTMIKYNVVYFCQLPSSLHIAQVYDLDLILFDCFIHVLFHSFEFHFRHSQLHLEFSPNHTSNNKFTRSTSAKTPSRTVPFPAPSAWWAQIRASPFEDQKIQCHHHQTLRHPAPWVCFGAEQPYLTSAAVYCRPLLLLAFAALNGRAPICVTVA